MKIRLAALAAVILSSAAVGTASAGINPIGQVYFIDTLGSELEQEPAKIFIRGGGENPCLRSLDWGRSWGGDRAVARGNYKDRCLPPVGFKTKAKVVLRRVGECRINVGPYKGQTVDVYKRGTVTFRHDGERVVQKFRTDQACK
jgi:hypothetical protein